MKLTLRPEWRLRPLSSFLGCLDLKTGVVVALLFAVLNKVAGVYGLIAVLTGAGGSAAQLSLYIYSVIGLTALVWGLKATTQEDAKKSLYFAHLFFADHILSTAWLVFFAVLWWVYTPHDGRRQANSEAQKEVMESGPGRNMTKEERTAAAITLWNTEKDSATLIIVMGWLAKFYFAALLYSYAIHLRKGSYRSLPHSRASANSGANGAAYATAALPDEDDEEVDDFYRLPVRAPPAPNGQAQSQSHGSGHNPSSSLSSIADFVSAPGRPRRGKPGKSSLSISTSANGRTRGGEETEVLFDEDSAESGSRDGRPEDRVPLVAASSSTSHSRRTSRSRN